MKTVAFHTLGCKVNTYESQAMARLFERNGYTRIDFKEKADVYVINTCTVTNTGDSKSRQMIRRAIRQNEKAIVCVVGCYSQVAKEEIEAIEGVDIILGTQHRDKIVELVEACMKEKRRKVWVEDVMKNAVFEELDVDVFTENTRAFLKIQDGCRNFCTYCIIPYARGMVRSRKKEDVLKQAQQLCDHGFQEIVLTGIHTANYGVDLENYSFYDLLVDLTTQIKGLKRLRISSIEASEITDEIITLIQNNTIIVDHLHIPLQSGCDTVLKRMNRKYNTQEYYEKIEHIRSSLPNVAITTDVIVGFPQESEEEFEQTRKFIEKVGYSELHVFPYSPRKNTPAASMKGQIDERVKTQRVHVLLDLSKQLHENYAKQFLDQELEVLFEEINHDGFLVGHASNYLKVEVDPSEAMINAICKVKVTSQNQGILKGKVISRNN